jgi:hypothetical protein
MQKWTDAQITPSPIGKTINNVSAINRNGELFSVQFIFGDNTTLTIDGHHNCSLWITHGGQPNDPSSPTAKPNAPEQDAEKSRSVQRMVRRLIPWLYAKKYSPEGMTNGEKIKLNVTNLAKQTGHILTLGLLKGVTSPFAVPNKR